MEERKKAFREGSSEGFEFGVREVEDIVEELIREYREAVH